MEGRIWFEGNPWPDGHAVRDFMFAGYLNEAGIGLILHLEAADYSEEYPDSFPDDEEDEEDEESDGSWWGSKFTWSNFGHATISNFNWGVDPDHLVPLLDPGQVFDLETLAPRRYLADPLVPEPEGGFPADDDLFHAYLLGHDQVRGHDIRIAPGHGAGLFDLLWSGRIALIYSGEYEFRHRFRAEIRNVPFAGFMVEPPPPPREGPGIIRHPLVPPAREQRMARLTALAELHLGGMAAFEAVPGTGGEADWLRIRT